MHLTTKPAACLAGALLAEWVTERKEVANMQRTILLAGVLPFVSAFLGGVLAFSLMAPSSATANQSGPRGAGISVHPRGSGRHADR